jgi:diadenosine tetraphosphate (Ap4A) HIT family hydrolase
MSACELCTRDGGVLLYRDDALRVVAVDGEDGKHYRGFCRVIWNAHVKEMTDLPGEDRARFMNIVYRVEAALRLSLNPDKINLASLGNMTPHLHWHVIPRFIDDIAFPKPVWAHSPTPAQVDTLEERSRRHGANEDWQAAVRGALETR